ncbi:unnamed protein product [Caenorhabditis auriculariae]|uniref:NADAR domain-containing protein n=1 Tax=Caenorhabditis auriculariae TaxID=2777116 RepID=A0A8S1H2R5_9PELO|nr:unnamed protein product [Caenorhabditis auriculariae]
MGTRRVRTEAGDLTLFFSKASPFSNFHPCNFVVVGDDDTLQKFSCVEQFYMYHKALTFGDTESAQKILKTRDPKEMKRIGKEIVGFSDPVWDNYKKDVMKNGLRAKFGQNQRLRECIFAAHDSRLVECSPMDRIWGIGLAVDNAQAENPALWRGTNLLGTIMDEVRDELWSEDGFRAERESVENEMRSNPDYCIQFFEKNFGVVPVSAASAPRPRLSQQFNVRKTSEELRRRRTDHGRFPLAATNSPPFKLSRADAIPDERRKRRRSASATSESSEDSRDRRRHRESSSRRRRDRDRRSSKRNSSSRRDRKRSRSPRRKRRRTSSPSSSVSDSEEDRRSSKRKDEKKKPNRKERRRDLEKGREKSRSSAEKDIDAILESHFADLDRKSLSITVTSDPGQEESSSKKDVLIELAEPTTSSEKELLLETSPLLPIPFKINLKDSREALLEKEIAEPTTSASIDITTPSVVRVEKKEISEPLTKFRVNLDLEDLPPLPPTPPPVINEENRESSDGKESTTGGEKKKRRPDIQLYVARPSSLSDKEKSAKVAEMFNKHYKNSRAKRS